VTEVVDAVFTDQAVISPAELIRNLANHVRVYRLFNYCHDDLLHWLMVRCEHPAPIVATEGRCGRCHLVTVNHLNVPISPPEQLDSATRVLVTVPFLFSVFFNTADGSFATPVRGEHFSDRRSGFGLRPCLHLRLRDRPIYRRLLRYMFTVNAPVDEKKWGRKKRGRIFGYTLVQEEDEENRLSKFKPQVEVQFQIAADTGCA